MNGQSEGCLDAGLFRYSSNYLLLTVVRNEPVVFCQDTLNQQDRDKSVICSSFQLHLPIQKAIFVAVLISL
jgi:hypothetical protein